MNKDQELKKLVKQFSLFDDTFFSTVMMDNRVAVEEILSIVLSEEVEIVSIEVQKSIPGVTPGFRGIRLDTLSRDSNENLYCLEVQRETDGAPNQRVNYYSDTVGVRTLFVGEEFDEMRDYYTIFLYEKDPLEKGYPIYKVQKVVEQTNEKYGRNEHILLVNGSYRKGKLGNLMEDFSQTDPNNITNPTLRESVMYYKQTKEGEFKVCKLVEEYAHKVYEEELKEAHKKADAKIKKAEKVRRKAEAKIKKAEVEKQKAEVEKQKAEVERQKAEVERQNSIQDMIKNLYRSNVALEIVKDSIKNSFHLDESQTMNFIAEFYK